jgi:hypothetical protein
MKFWGNNIGVWGVGGQREIIAQAINSVQELIGNEIRDEIEE